MGSESLKSQRDRELPSRVDASPQAERAQAQDGDAHDGLDRPWPAAGNTVADQASQLAKFSTAQRQSLASKIGRLHGNRHLQRVTGLLQPAGLVQRENGDDEEESAEAEGTEEATTPSFSLGTGGFGSRPSLIPELQLDPSIQARMQAIQFMMEQLDPTRIRPRLLELDPSLAALPSAATTPAAPQEETPLVPAGRGPARPREGSGGDVVEAVMALPLIDQALTTLQTRAVDQVRRDWGRLSTGEQVAAVTAVVLVGGGALAGAMTHPEGREFLLGQLNGRVIPVPGVTGLSVEFNTAGENLMVGLHLDVGSLLPEWMGFGPSSPSAIGAPPGQ